MGRGRGQRHVPDRPHPVDGRRGRRQRSARRRDDVRPARQRPARGVRHHDLPRGRLETHDERQLPLGSAHLVPGQEEAVRVAQVRLAVVQRKLFGQKDVFLFGHGVFRVGAAVVEDVDAQRAFHLDGLLLVFGVEHDPAAEAAHRRLARLVADRVSPHGHHPVGHGGLFLEARQGEVRPEVQLGAPG